MICDVFWPWGCHITFRGFDGCQDQAHVLPAPIPTALFWPPGVPSSSLGRAGGIFPTTHGLNVSSVTYISDHPHLFWLPFTCSERDHCKNNLTRSTAEAGEAPRPIRSSSVVWFRVEPVCIFARLNGFAGSAEGWHVSQDVYCKSVWAQPRHNRSLAVPSKACYNEYMKVTKGKCRSRGFFLPRWPNFEDISKQVAMKKETCHVSLWILGKGLQTPCFAQRGSPSKAPRSTLGTHPAARLQQHLCLLLFGPFGNRSGALWGAPPQLNTAET